MTVTIHDTGATRVVEIAGEQHGFYGIVQHSRFETPYSRETLAALLAVKGEMWLRDEIVRAEDPAYVQEPLRCQFARFGWEIAGRRVLDFGCGCGGSTLCLARLGAASVTGVEPRPEFVAAARLRARDSGLTGRVAFEHLPDTTRLPFDDGSFDAVVMNAVVEHIPPADRPAHLAEVWRAIAAGGRLFIGETPNRLWPQDYHTTGLWGVPYLPLGLARRYAIARGRAPAGATSAWLLSEGIRGGSYWEIARALGPNAVCLNRVQRDDVARFWARALAKPGQSVGRLTLKSSLYAVHRLLDRILLRPLGIPAVAFLPELSLCFTKGQN
ncbi:MAG: class I SAM-dependent methyltransferase [Chloroflexi bacterium]|nr:class I SAM-dependent methyltransferase [Chloroflexota bacterium]